MIPVSRFDRVKHWSCIIHISIHILKCTVISITTTTTATTTTTTTQIMIIRVEEDRYHISGLAKRPVHGQGVSLMASCSQHIY